VPQQCKSYIVGTLALLHALLSVTCKSPKKKVTILLPDEALVKELSRERKDEVAHHTSYDDNLIHQGRIELIQLICSSTIEW
jgi:hypothetical protein